ncbi:MAG: UDP-N-acetylglucosamine--N-acetylmuramyl-(pentapeptide) pyrophosphoryl-undecaprenol N-acetylglucosamine transferase [Candidatus Omnitrophica bacterium]|nr:UDP-N-acetylglucosamine--N-acetylmuramyl-(pentapeptide) pyrophosphoryl-undecaprenol N-acetylglucosamine transferase [Candidatus Omnitrophota bacterium]MCK5287934.1 UDP-N-acetylglucosamine--N-acetylmuramyl-(pentapeptide) pyrophosphoryl-undecaprenol N-acetylglucosamine transferase [Candidatus Omnitrophota bacterium]
MRILLACERSGGHVFPALTIGKKIRNKSNNVYFFVTSSALKKYIKNEGFYVLGRSFTFRNLFLELFWRCFEAFYVILKSKPHEVIGFGGRDSFFLVLWSALLGLDTKIYEPNLKFGKANRILSIFVSKMLRGFPYEGNNKKNIVIGIPLRQNIRKIDKSEARKILNFDNKPVIFCFGGSQGSVFINDVFIEFVKKFRKDYQIIHITGKIGCFEIEQFYNTIDNRKFVRSFYYDIGVLYSAADIVVSRAGAGTLGEISFYKIPSILIPHPGGGGHQKENASYFAEREVANMYMQNTFCYQNFNIYLRKIICDEDLRNSMSRNFNRIKLGVGYEDFCKDNRF